MGKIEKLTTEQEKRLPSFREEWFRWGISTARADRTKAEAAILEMRGEIGVSKKPIFVWCESPETSLLALHVLKSNEWKLFIEGLRSSLRSSLEEEAASRPSVVPGAVDANHPIVKLARGYLQVVVEDVTKHASAAKGGLSGHLYEIARQAKAGLLKIEELVAPAKKNGSTAEASAEAPA